MLWRGWSLLAGLPVGALAASAVGAGLALHGLAALAGGLLMLAAVALLRRLRDDDPARGSLLARAASSGLAALPALGASALAAGPGPGALLALQLALTGGLLWRASRSHGGPCHAPAQIAAAVGWLAAGFGVALLAAVASGLASGSGPLLSAEREALVYDLDARVATLPLPACPGPALWHIRLERGARPRLGPREAWLWYDAEVGGARQVHALELETGRSACRTCGEPGDNLRPDPGPAGVVFESLRHAGWWQPANSELYFARGDAGASEPSRRLTRDPGPDDHALLAPGSAQVVWSRRRGDGYQIVSAPLASAHGALILSGESVWLRGGGDWIAPVAWSRDARALVVERGNPWAPRRAQVVDFAGGGTRNAALDLAPGGAAISGDGGVWALAATHRSRVVGLLPSPLVAPFAPLAAGGETNGGGFRGTTLRVGAADAPQELLLPEVSAWGAPTGVALSRDGRRLFLAQRSPRGEERILEIERGCDPP